MKFPNKKFIIKTFTIIFVILISNNQGISQNTVGLILNDTTQTYKGYTLFAPNTAKTTFLIDNDGRLVNKWESDYFPAMSAYLLEDGHLLRTAKKDDPTEASRLFGGFQKFEWDGTLV